MANNIYGFTVLTGGADGALDNIDGTLLADGDMAFGISSGVFYAYALDADSGATESSPTVIAPNDNAGTKRWILSSSMGGASEQNIVQNTHGFASGDRVYHNGTIYAKAKADAVATAEEVGMVSAVADANNFTLTSGGYVSGLSGLTAGTVYFLSDATAGAGTATEPTEEGHVSKPDFIAVSTTAGFYFNMRGSVIGPGSTCLIQTFTNADLSSGILTVTHSFGHQYCNEPTIIDNNGKTVTGYETTYSSTTQLTIDLSDFGTISGTWRVVVQDTGASTAADMQTDRLLSVTNVSLAADADTIIYTVPTAQTCILTRAILIAGANANSTDISIGQDGATTDWIGTTQCDNLDASGDCIILQPVPAATPVKSKAYAAGTVIKITVSNQAGGATNSLRLYGMLY